MEKITRTLVLCFAQPANGSAIRALEQFTSTPGAALGALEAAGLVVVPVKALRDLIAERDELARSISRGRIR